MGEKELLFTFLTVMILGISILGSRGVEEGSAGGIPEGEKFENPGKDIDYFDLDWKYDIGGEVYDAEVAPDGSMIMISEDNLMRSLTSEGKLNWELPVLCQKYNEIVIDEEGTIFYIGMAHLHIIDSHGTLLWKELHHTTNDEAPGLLPNGNVVFTSGNTALICLNRNGSLVWKWEVGYSVDVQGNEEFLFVQKEPDAWIEKEPVVVPDGRIILYLGGSDNPWCYVILDQNGSTILHHTSTDPIIGDVKLIGDQITSLVFNRTLDQYSLTCMDLKKNKVWSKGLEGGPLKWPLFDDDGDIYVRSMPEDEDISTISRFTSSGEDEGLVLEYDDSMNSVTFNDRTDVFVMRKDQGDSSQLQVLDEEGNTVFVRDFSLPSDDIMPMTIQNGKIIFQAGRTMLFLEMDWTVWKLISNISLPHSSEDSWYDKRIFYDGDGITAFGKDLVHYDLEGNEVWTYRVGGPPLYQPILDPEGDLYVVPCQDTVLKIDRDGDLIREMEPPGQITGAPAVWGDDLILPLKGDLFLYREGEFVLIDEDIKSVDFETVVHPRGNALVVTDGSKLVSICGNLTKEWSYESDQPITGAPAIDGEGNIFFPSTDTVISLDGQGRERWKKKGGSWALEGSVTITDDKVIAPGDPMVALDPEGNPIWELDDPYYGGFGEVVSGIGEFIYSRATEYELYVIYRENGTLHHSLFPGSSTNAPVMDNDGDMYTGSEYLSCLDQHGELKWIFTTQPVQEFNRDIHSFRPLLDTDGSIIFVSNTIHRITGVDDPPDKPPFELLVDQYGVVDEFEWEIGGNGAYQQILGFRIYRGDSPDKMDPCAELGPRKLRFDEMKKENRGRTYYYQVSAVTASGESERSGVVEVRYSNFYEWPDKPRDFDISNGLNWIELSWEHSDDMNYSPPTNYCVYRSTNGVNYQRIEILPSNATSYRDRDVEFMQNYYYYVTANNEYGESSTEPLHCNPMLNILILVIALVMVAVVLIVVFFVLFRRRKYTGEVENG